MRGVLLIAAVLGAVAAAIACGTGPVERVGDVTFPADDTVILGPDNKPAPTGPAGSGLATGLPCDVQAIVENRCVGCHAGTTPGAPRLLEYADFIAPSVADPATTMAQSSLARMRSATSPMPPKPAATPEAEEIAAFQSWVAGGTKKGGLCTDPPADGGVDAGALPEAGGGDAGDAGGPACTSGTMWTMGNARSPLMHPGLACNACHAGAGGPNLRFAGTVYRGLHDIDDCNGAGPPPPLTVEITDKNGKMAKLAVNAAGNFELRAGGGGGGGNPNSFVPPYRARVIDGALSRPMVGSVTSGDCNSCHSAAGKNGAPGRILAP